MDPLYDIFYEKYLLLHSLHGDARPLLDRGEYEKLDKELRDLVDISNTHDLTMSQLARIKEVEFLLLDDVAEGFYT